ncbi:Sucrose nonfermenting 4-like protein [Camellia lanceoleosa]|uniref:Sucrose nonfermenting 4-like protein n=1 Tax=Camellia lanceoleosa TaxID=1840588 RepID=A0ACC0IE29_9ERIC|nr:Sucrose nonfermenting 4-like protein [Camellia lanceoleosa]
MFGSGVDIGPDKSGVLGPVLVPKQFVWRYGGRRVFLSGSFTRWTEHIPMSPMEGSPTVFQVICSLTPGYHQYKFIVDGEWQHDENEDFVSGNYGVVNTLILLREPNVIHAVYSPETPGISNMDVDYDPFLRLEAIPRISEADIEISRNRVSVFMSTHTAYELLPESGKVIALDINLPVKQAFHILYEQGIPVAPLWDFGKGLFVGVLSALYFILILRELGNHGSNLTEEELETHTISAWKEGKSHLNRQINGSGRSCPRRLVHAGPYDSLKDVALKILQNKVATVPIIHSSSQDGSFPQLLHLASLWNSKIDITALAKDRAYAQISLDEMSIHQALQLGQDASSPYGFFSGQRCQMCLRSDPLHKVIERLAIPGVRRLVIVEAGSKRVEGIVSLSDVFQFLLGC